MSTYTVLIIPDLPSYIYYVNNKLTHIIQVIKKYCHNRDDIFLEKEHLDENKVLLIMSHNYLETNDIIRFNKIDNVDDKSLSFLTKQIANIIK